MFNMSMAMLKCMEIYLVRLLPSVCKSTKEIDMCGEVRSQINILFVFAALLYGDYATVLEEIKFLNFNMVRYCFELFCTDVK